MNKYPKYTDFPIENIIYGVGAPRVGCGIYTIDRKFSWPDRECTMKDEYFRWKEHLEDTGYDIPEEYLNAYVEFSPVKTTEEK
jgi:hypothetical protein